MESKTKIIIGTGVAIALASVAFIIYKKISSRGKFVMPPIVPTTTDNPSNSNSNTSWSPKISATLIHDSMKGYGTDDDLFFKTAEALTSSERTKVKDYFNNNLGDGDNLCDWIEGDFSGSDEDKALALFGYPTGAYWSNCE